jgi:hypothetical protein
MVERNRSKDGKREAQEIAEQAEVGHQGRAGGRLARQIGTEDELKRAFERPAGATRVTKSDEKDEQKNERQG